MRFNNHWIVRCLCLGVVSVALAPRVRAGESTTFFEEKIRPVLVAECFKCHSERSGKSKGGLSLDRRDSVLEGGDRGAALVPGDPDRSLVMVALRRVDDDLAMPPKEALPSHVVADFERWIAEGAVFPDTGFVSGGPSRDWWEDYSDANLPPRDRELAQVIDFFVDQKAFQAGTPIAPQTSEVNLARRLTLDLNGRSPTPGEVVDYLETKQDSKRGALVDRLLNSAAFSRFLANELTWRLMGEEDKPFREFLTDALASHRPWDEIVKDILLVESPNQWKEGADRFLRTRVKDIDSLATDASVALFGVNISCAQCHDHPEVSDWTQERYYGMKSFFNRTFENGDFIGERAYGKVSYKTTSGEDRTARLLFLDGTAIAEPEVPEPDGEEKKRIQETLEALKEEKKPVPAPEFSRRAQLVETGLSEGSDGFFSRAIVNWVWKSMMGRGLVEPADQMHGANPPSHPELLAWLARDFSENGYDLRRLIRGVVMSRAYSRSSEWPEEARPDPSLFAVGSIRPLAPRPYARVLAQATQGVEWLESSNELASSAFDERVAKVESAGERFKGWFERPDGNFRVSVDEALTLSNDPDVDKNLFRSGNAAALKRLENMESAEERIDFLYRWALGRSPAFEETQWALAFVDRLSPEDVSGWRHLLWAILTSPEARFNH